jgi:hypothetical protein
MGAAGGVGCAIGEWEEQDDSPAETCFHFRTGTTNVVPWLVVSESGHADRAQSPALDGCSAPKEAASSPAHGGGKTALVS